MSAGLDSIGATELARKLSDGLGTRLPSTLLFDHPSINTIVQSLSLTALEPGVIPAREERSEVAQYKSANQVGLSSLAADVGEVIGEVLRSSGTAIAAEASLMAAGLDSITATELS
jgi:acyl carrier protein